MITLPLVMLHRQKTWKKKKSKEKKGTKQIPPMFLVLKLHPTPAGRKFIALHRDPSWVIFCCLSDTNTM